MAFNRDRNNRPGGGFRPRPSFGDRPRFGDRSDRGPVEMHKAICDNCGKECEVPFRPTSGKPVYCSDCFEKQKGSSDSRRFEGRNSDRSGNFGDRRNNGGNRDERSAPVQNDRDNRFEELNAKLDKILSILSPVIPIEEDLVAEEETEKPVIVEKAKKKTPAKKSSAKK